MLGRNARRGAPIFSFAWNLDEDALFHGARSRGQVRCRALLACGCSLVCAQPAGYWRRAPCATAHNLTSRCWQRQQAINYERERAQRLVEEAAAAAASREGADASLPPPQPQALAAAAPATAAVAIPPSPERQAAQQARQHPLMSQAPEDTTSVLVIQIERRMWCATTDEVGLTINRDDEQESPSCAICLDEMQAGAGCNACVTFPCGHCFHTLCARKSERPAIIEKVSLCTQHRPLCPCCVWMLIRMRMPTCCMQVHAACEQKGLRARAR